MPFDMIAFSEATPGTGLVNVAPASGEDLYRVSVADNWIRMKKQASRQILGVFCAACSTGEDYRLRQPSHENTFALDQQFHKIQLMTDLDPTFGMTHLFGRPIPCRPNEQLQALIQNATDEAALIGVMVGTAKITTPMIENTNPTFSILGIGDTTVAARTWTTCAITWNQQVPEGVYAIIGMKVGVWRTAQNYAALARIAIPANLDWRPGVPCALMEADHEEYQSISHAPWNDWPLMSGRAAKFDEDHMPNIQICAESTLTDQNVELLIQKVAG